VALVIPAGGPRCQVWISEQTSVGAQQEPLSNIERFLLLIRFERRSKLDALPVTVRRVRGVFF